MQGREMNCISGRKIFLTEEGCIESIEWWSIFTGPQSDTFSQALDADTWAGI